VRIEEYYPGGAPIIIQVAFKHGYGPAIVELNKKVYFNDDLSISAPVMEAIQGLCLSSCDNQYCAIMHARGMITAGLTLEEVQRLIELQQLPDSIPNKEPWEHTLRRIAAIFRDPYAAPHLYRSLSEFQDDRTIEEIGGIVAFSLLHKFLLEMYDEEIKIDEEPILFETVDCGSELISFFSKQLDKTVPVYTICSICNDLKGEQGWVPIEKTLSDVPADAIFSHGVCEKCLDRWMAMQ